MAAGEARSARCGSSRHVDPRSASCTPTWRGFTGRHPRVPPLAGRAARPADRPGDRLLPGLQPRNSVDGHTARVPRRGGRLQRGVSRARGPGALRAPVGRDSGFTTCRSRWCATTRARASRKTCPRSWWPAGSCFGCTASSWRGTTRSSSSGIGCASSMPAPELPRAGDGRDRGQHLLLHLPTPGRPGSVASLAAQPGPGVASSRGHRRRQRRRRRRGSPSSKPRALEGMQRASTRSSPLADIARARNRSLAAGNRRVRRVHRRRRGGRSRMAARALAGGGPQRGRRRDRAGGAEVRRRRCHTGSSTAGSSSASGFRPARA